MPNIQENLKKITTRIRKAAEKSNRNPDSIKLLAVSKRIHTDKINEAIQAGVSIIAENRIQEAREKSPLLHKVKCHFIGHLQKNKIKYIFDLFKMVHSVDSLELAEAINSKAAEQKIVMDILLQVNISGEKSKFGISPESASKIFEKMVIMENVSVKGLMTIPPATDHPEDSRPYFRQLSHLKNDLNRLNKENNDLQELSMGMSNDFEIAIEEGSTMVRVGTAIFGERN